MLLRSFVAGAVGLPPLLAPQGRRGNGGSKMTNQKVSKTTTKALSHLREYVIISKALAYAIEAIDSLPGEWQEKSTCDDMVRLLEAQWGPGDVACFRSEARRHLSMQKRNSKT